MNSFHKTSRHSKADYLLQFLFYGIILVILGVFALGIKFLAIPLLLSILVYYTLHNLVDRMESYGMNRALSIFILFLLFGGGIYFLIYTYVPTVLEKLSPFLTYWSQEFENPDNNRFSEQVDYLFRIESEIIQKALPPGEIAKSIITFAKDTIEEVIDSIPKLLTILLITPILSFFLLLDANSIYKGFVSMVPNRYFEMTLMITSKINAQLTNYLKGLMIQSSIMAIVGSVGFYFVGLKFFVIFGIFLGVANTIPYIGPVIGMIPPALFALVTGGGIEAAIPVAVVVLICQLVDNVLVQPTVIAKSASLHPILVLIGITVGGNLLGLWGMLLAIPILSVLKVSFNILYNSLREHGVI